MIGDLYPLHLTSQIHTIRNHESNNSRILPRYKRHPCPHDYSRNHARIANDVLTDVNRLLFLFNGHFSHPFFAPISEDGAITSSAVATLLGVVRGLFNRLGVSSAGFAADSRGSLT